MANKIGRNDPCPCGSGLKYKNCCLRKFSAGNVVPYNGSNASSYAGINDCTEISDYFKTHSTADIFNFIIGLQLSPANHGKNVRIEELARQAVQYAHSGGGPVIQSELEAILDRDFGQNHMEDLPCNMFSEYVAFYGGAHTTFPGITCKSIEILNDLLSAVFKTKNAIPSNIEHEMSFAVQLIFTLGEYYAKLGDVVGNHKGIEYEDPRFDYSQCGKDYSILADDIQSVGAENITGLEVLKDFILDMADPDIAIADPDHSPLLQKPLVEFGGKYYFLLISNEANAISSFIMKKVIECKCEDSIAHSMRQHIWNGIRYGCTRMEWLLTTFELPENKDPYIEEVVAQFDVNWIAYLCYVHDLGESFKDAVNGGEFFYQVDDHIKEAVGFLRNNPITKDYHILTLLLYSSSGETFMLPHNGGELEDYRLSFSAYDFIDLSQSEHWNRLSLLRFAQMEKRHESCFGLMLNSLDVYSLYKSKKESFYLSDKEKYTSIFIPPDDGMHLIFDSKIKRDFRAVDIVKKGEFFTMPVICALDGMPIYKPDVASDSYYVVTIAYSVPIWVHCNQVRSKHSHEYEAADLYGMAIAFWLTRLSPALYKTVSERFTRPFNIELIFDEDLFDQYRHENDFTESSEEAFEFSSCGSTLSLRIHRSSMSTMAVGTNAGERDLMRKLIARWLNLDDVVISCALDNYMPLSSAKMILLTDTGKNEIMDPRNLHQPLYISNAMDQMILESLPEYMAEKNLDIDGSIETTEAKINFLNSLVDVLFEKLHNEVVKYSKVFLLRHIVDVNESLIWDREHDGIIVPAKFLCLADTKEKREEYLEHERVLTDSSLAARCLAEYVVSLNNNGGSLIPGGEEIEHMMALMRAIITFGSQSDSLHYGIANVQIEKLGSGRYAITDDAFQEGMEEFSRAYVEEDINRHIASFPSRLQIMQSPDTKSPQEIANPYCITPEDVNNAFATDWGISFTDIDAFCYGCYSLCINKNTSALDIDSDTFEKEIMALQPSLTKGKIQTSISHFSLSERGKFLTAPEGYKNQEVFPWVYNRELSYIRRFILSYNIGDGNQRYILGPRSAMASLRQLATLLSDGRLQAETAKLKALRSKFNDIKGEDFNEDVREYLKENISLKVWDWEVKISTDGNLTADKNYGDIDVMAYDANRKILFAIECKNTEKARNIREMKTELGKYFGLPGEKKKGYIQKHIDRDRWLKDNYDQVKNYVDKDNDFEIKSIIMTSEVIPLSYISKLHLELPILAFSQLKSRGIDQLYEVADKMQ